MQSCKQKSRTPAMAWKTPRRTRGSGQRPWRRRTCFEGELQVVNFAELVVHCEERLDHRLYLVGHAVELLERDPLQLTAHLFVEVEEARDTPGRHEAPVHLLVGRKDAVEPLADAVAG